MELIKLYIVRRKTMEDKKIIKKIKEWLISDMGEESYPQAVRMNSMALLEYIEKWENQKDGKQN
jgi:hypothetical protein